MEMQHSTDRPVYESICNQLAVLTRVGGINSMANVNINTVPSKCSPHIW